jgi:hypothetical protein
MVAASRNAERKPWPMAHPFDPSSIAVEAFNPGHIAVSPATSAACARHPTQAGGSQRGRGVQKATATA